MKAVLVIEDNYDHFSLIEDALQEDKGSEFLIEHVDHFSVGLEKLAQKKYDICFCDLDLPDSRLAATVEKLQSLETQTPIVVLSSTNSEDIAKELLNQGIQDYLPKSEISGILIQRISLHAIYRKKLQLSEKRKQEEMKIFCSSLSHDFTGTIGNIQSVAQLIKKQLSSRLKLEQGEEALFGYLEQSTSEINSLIRELTKYLSVGLRQENLERVDLADLINCVAKKLKLVCEKDFKIELSDDLPKITAPKAMLEILFQNLIENSIKYCDNDPVVSISRKLDQDQDIVQLIISDNGIGMSREDLARIFKPFQRLHSDNKKFRGTGLGLSIVNKIVENLDATISVTSEKGVGSTFSINLSSKMLSDSISFN